MSPRLGRRLCVLALITTALAISSAQTLRKSKIKNPVHEPDNEELQKSARKSEQDKAVPHSPFTPPPDLVVKEVTRSRTEPPPTTSTVAPVEAKKERAPEERPDPGAGSPFSPPPSREWREPSKRARPTPEGSQKPVRAGKSSSWLDSVQERQNDNVDSIPPLADIVVTETSPSPARRRSKARSKSGQGPDKGHRDIHEAEPGVTPWTRYTDKPRVKLDLTSSGKANAQCGRTRYNPRKQICCEGHVARRHGLSPACCLGQAYDTVFNKCCNGLISDRAHGQSDC